jgi:hypothetical protein
MSSVKLLLTPAEFDIRCEHDARVRRVRRRARRRDLWLVEHRSGRGRDEVCTYNLVRMRHQRWTVSAGFRPPESMQFPGVSLDDIEKLLDAW